MILSLFEKGGEKEHNKKTYKKKVRKQARETDKEREREKEREKEGEQNEFDFLKTKFVAEWCIKTDHPKKKQKEPKLGQEKLGF